MLIVFLAPGCFRVAKKRSLEDLDRRYQNSSEDQPEISPRARDMIREMNLISCEDYRYRKMVRTKIKTKQLNRALSGQESREFQVWDVIGLFEEEP